MLAPTDFPTDSHITGVKPKMNGNIMSLIYWHSSKKLYFMAFNFGTNTASSVLIYSNILEKPFSVFINSGT